MPKSWVCGCGARNSWIELNCEACGREKQGENQTEIAAVSCWICQQCGEKSAGCVPTGKGRLCAKCNFAHVRASASRPEDICPECGKQVAEHMRETRELVAKIGRAEWASTDRT